MELSPSIAGFADALAWPDRDAAGNSPADARYRCSYVATSFPTPPRAGAAAPRIERELVETLADSFDLQRIFVRKRAAWREESLRMSVSCDGWR
jgi:hypothetical protein